MASRILVVDDSHIIIEMLKFILDVPRYALRYCDDGRYAADLLSREAFDLVITDLDMPGLDGRQLLGIVRDRYPGTKVVIHTASGIDEEEFIALGAYEILKKPADIDRIIDVVDLALNPEYEKVM